MARVDVIMPQMGESIAEGTLSRWLKKVGDEVKRDEPIFEISTDKVDAEIPAPSAGVLAEILVTEGQTVPVQTVVARLETEKGAAVGAPGAAAPAAGAGDGNSRAKAPSAVGGPPPKTESTAPAAASSHPPARRPNRQSGSTELPRGTTSRAQLTARAEDGGRARHRDRHASGQRDRWSGDET